MNAICEKTGKRSYRHYQQAASVVGIAQKSSRGLTVAPISAYRCKACGNWHTSSMTQLEHEVRVLVRASA